jgi:hypothetical protein
MNTSAIIRFGLAFLVLFFGFTVSSGFGQIKVTKLNGNEALQGKTGIVYNLPRTAIHVSLKVEKTHQIPGPLAAYAADFLGLDNAPVRETVQFNIAGATIQAVTEPDPGQYYLIEKEEKSASEVWLSFADGSPVMVLEKFEKGMAPAGFAKWDEQLFIKPDPAFLFKKYTDSPTRELIDTIIRKVSIDTLVIEEQIFKRSMVEFSDEEKAQEAAARIREIEHDKYNLLIGYQETAYSKETLEYMLSELDELRQQYLKLFTGVKVVQEIMFDHVLFPGYADEANEYAIAGFSRTTGIVEADETNAVKLTLVRDNEGLKVDENSAGQGGGLVYRIPVPVRFELSYQGREIAAERLEVLQLSPLFTLPAAFTKIEIDRNTGALRSVLLQ